VSFVDDVKGEEPTCPTCEGNLPCPCSRNVEKAGTSKTGDTLTATLPVDEAGKDRVYAMLATRGFDPDEWIIVSLTVNEWETPRTEDQGTRLLTQTKASLKRVLPYHETEWGRFVALLREPVKREPQRKLKDGVPPGLWVLMGDDQAPFVNQPLHEAACEMLSDLDVTGLVYMGDGVDFPDVSRFRKEPGRFSATVTDCINSLHQILTDRAEASGAEHLYYLPGNHEERLSKSVLDKLPELFGITRAGSDQHVLSVDYLARLADIGFEWVTDSKGDYPHATLKIADGTGALPPLVATHGWVARKGAGNSARSSIEHLNASIVVGHTHRCAISMLTRWNPDSETYALHHAAETGTMADPAGLGYARYPDWQPGFLTASIGDDGGYSLGAALFDGTTLRWRDRSWTVTPRGIRRS